MLRALREFNSPQSDIITLNGKELLNFSSNDYLGLANNSDIKGFFGKAIKTWGVGSGSSRLLSGTFSPHIELENSLAQLKSCESCLSFSSGYTSGLGTLTALFGSQDVIILDKLCHASLVDGTKLSGAKIRIFKHNDIESLRKKLQWAESFLQKNGKQAGKICVIAESIYSMDGDVAPLAGIAKLKEEFGFLLMVDEAHAFGVFGEGGAGLGNELQTSKAIDIHMGTLSKAVGLSGGFVCASREIIEMLVNKARSFIYSTAHAPALAETANFALKLIASEEGKKIRFKLMENILQADKLFSDFLPMKNLAEQNFSTQILPVIIGKADKALALSDKLQRAGFFVPAIRYPTVAKDQARLRISLTANHSTEQIEQLAKVIQKEL